MSEFASHEFTPYPSEHKSFDYMLLSDFPVICPVFRPNKDEGVKFFFGARIRRFSVLC